MPVCLQRVASFAINVRNLNSGFFAGLRWEDMTNEMGIRSVRMLAKISSFSEIPRHGAGLNARLQNLSHTTEAFG